MSSSLLIDTEIFHVIKRRMDSKFIFADNVDFCENSAGMTQITFCLVTAITGTVLEANFRLNVLNLSQKLPPLSKLACWRMSLYQ